MRIFPSILIVLLVACEANVQISADEQVRNAENVVREVHDQLFKGFLTEDANLVDRILSADVTLGFPGGYTMPREEFLNYLRGGELFYDSVEHHALQVRVYGDTAIFHGRSTLFVRFQDISSPEHLTYTAVYVRATDGFELVAWQSTEPCE